MGVFLTVIIKQKHAKAIAVRLWIVNRYRKTLITVFTFEKPVFRSLYIYSWHLVRPKLITHLSLSNSIAQSCDDTYKAGLVEAVLYIKRRLTWKQTAAINMLV